eukprot:gene386-550_t
MPWVCKDGSVTLAWVSRLKAGSSYYWNDIPVPPEMMVNGKLTALEYLERIGYYRLSGYWFAFRERTELCCPLIQHKNQKPTKTKPGRIPLDIFKPGTTFQNAVDLYVFDKRLRLLAMDALERIEIALRVDISHGLGKHENRSNEDFIRHNKEKYGLPLAVWVACEVWDFGTLSTLYAGMTEADQDAISQEYGISNGRVFASWLRSLNYLRNGMGVDHHWQERDW